MKASIVSDTPPKLRLQDGLPWARRELLELSRGFAAVELTGLDESGARECTHVCVEALNKTYKRKLRCPLVNSSLGDSLADPPIVPFVNTQEMLIQ